MNETIAKRYARALFLISLEKNMLDEVSKDLLFVHELLVDSNVYNFFQARQVANAKKKEMLLWVGNNLSELTVNLFKILIDRKRVNIFSLIREKFDQLVNENDGIATATIYSPWDISKEMVTEIEREFSKLIDKQTIRVTESIVEKILLGGIRLRVGNIIIDSSVYFQLLNMEKNLLNKVVSN